MTANRKQKRAILILHFAMLIIELIPDGRTLPLQLSGDGIRSSSISSSWVAVLQGRTGQGGSTAAFENGYSGAIANRHRGTMLVKVK